MANSSRSSLHRLLPSRAAPESFADKSSTLTSPAYLEAWVELSNDSCRQWESKMRRLLTEADAAANEEVEKVVYLREMLIRQVTADPGCAASALESVAAEVRLLEGRLLAAEDATERALEQAAADLFVSLFQRCRERSEQDSVMGGSCECETGQYLDAIRATFNDKKAWVRDHAHARRQQVVSACARHLSALQELVERLDDVDGCSTLDGSVTDLLDGSTLDGSVTDLMETMSMAGLTDTSSVANYRSKNYRGPPVDRELDETCSVADTVDGSISDLLSTFDTVVTMTSSCHSSATARTLGSGAGGRRGRRGEGGDGSVRGEERRLRGLRE